MAYVIRLLSLLLLVASISGAYEYSEDIIIENTLTPLELQLVAKKAPLLKPVVEEGSLYLFYKACGPTRYVSVAFDFDGYRKQYVMYRLEEEGEIFYVKVKLPLYLKEVSYRYIVDGLWTSDPNNAYFKENFLGDRFSVVSLGEYNYTFGLCNPTYTAEGKVLLKFINDPGQVVSVAGNFNNWNPFIDQMKEDSQLPGLYYIELEIPHGEVYYYFIVAGTRYLDPLNPVYRKASFLRPLEGQPGGSNVSYFNFCE